MASNNFTPATVRVNFQQESPATTWNINHGIGTTCPVIDVYTMQSGQYKKVFPAHTYVIDANNAQLTFTDPQSGYATVM